MTSAVKLTAEAAINVVIDVALSGPILIAMDAIIANVSGSGSGAHQVSITLARVQGSSVTRVLILTALRNSREVVIQQ